MKAVCWLFLLLTALACADESADSAAIRAHIESIFQAFVDKDRAKLVATHGAEWRGFTPWSGHVIRGRDGYMNEATFPPDLPKTQGMVGYRIGEFDRSRTEDRKRGRTALHAYSDASVHSNCNRD